MSVPRFADVAELADAQVSEACDGDIVEVQVLSSAPIFQHKSVASALWTRVFIGSNCQQQEIQKTCHGIRMLGVLPIRG